MSRGSLFVFEPSKFFASLSNFIKVPLSYASFSSNQDWKPGYHHTDLFFSASDQRDQKPIRLICQEEKASWKKLSTPEHWPVSCSVLWLSHLNRRLAQAGAELSNPSLLKRFFVGSHLSESTMTVISFLLANYPCSETQKLTQPTVFFSAHWLD